MLVVVMIVVVMCDSHRESLHVDDDDQENNNFLYSIIFVKMCAHSDHITPVTTPANPTQSSSSSTRFRVFVVQRVFTIRNSNAHITPVTTPANPTQSSPS